MADNRKESKENQTHCIFKDLMVEDLIEALEVSKIEFAHCKSQVRVRFCFFRFFFPFARFCLYQML